MVNIFDIKLFCFFVTMSLVRDVEAIHGLFLLLTSSGNIFSEISNARETAMHLCILKGAFID